MLFRSSVCLSIHPVLCLLSFLDFCLSRFPLRSSFSLYNIPFHLHRFWFRTHTSLNRSYDTACLYMLLSKRVRLFLWNVCVRVRACLCPQSTGLKQSTFTDWNLNDFPVSSYRPRLLSWVENFIVAPMLSISCYRNQQYLVPAWSRIHLGKAAATMLLKEFLSCGS